MSKRTTRSPTDKAAELSRRSEQDQIMATLRPLVKMLRATLGAPYEVVLHDLRSEHGTIIEIAGDVTGRHVGGSMSEIGLSLVARADELTELVNYRTTTLEGKVIRSSTALLRDHTGEPFGAFCVNVDVTQLQSAANLLMDLSGTEEQTPSTTVFSDDPEAVIDQLLQRHLLAMNGQASFKSPSGRRRVIKALDEAGVFSLQRSTPYIAEKLGVSRATVYSDLAAVRESDAPME